MTKTKAIAKNSLHLYCRMLVVLAASLYTVRVVLNALGVDDFGIYGVAGGMVALFAFLNSTMTRAAQRFLGVELGRGDPEASNRTFNAILAANAAIALFVVLVSLTLGLWLLNNKLNIPPSRLDAARIVLFYSVATTAAMILRTPFSAVIISRQRMWFFSATSIGEAALKLGTAFAISHSPDGVDKLELYAILTCAVSWLLLACYVMFCRRHFLESRIRVVNRWEPYRTLGAFVSWSFIGNFAYVARTQGVNVLLNIFFGTSLNAAYGVMNQAQGAASQFTNSFELALSPQIYQSYGKGDRAAVLSLVSFGSKLNFMLFAVLVGPAIYGMDYVLNLWLGRSIDYLTQFVIWMLILQLIETISQPLMVAALATGNIKRYQLAVGGTILLNLPLTALAFSLGYGPTSFLYIAVVIHLLTFALRLAFMRPMIGMNIALFLRDVGARLAVASILGAAAVVACRWYFGNPGSLLELLRGSIVLLPVIVAICVLVGLTAPERRMLISKLASKVDALKNRNA